MIGENVRNFREQKGLSMTDLADRALISKSYLSNIERNLKTNPTIDILLRISNVLEVNMYDLIDLEDLNKSYNISAPLEDSSSSWSHIEQLAEVEGIKRNQVSDYKVLFDFIRWHREQMK